MKHLERGTAVLMKPADSSELPGITLGGTYSFARYEDRCGERLVQVYSIYPAGVLVGERIFSEYFRIVSEVCALRVENDL